MIRRPPRSTPKPSSAASDVYKRQDKKYSSKIAEREVFLKSKIQEAMTNGEFEEAQQLEQELSREIRSLRSSLESEKESIRKSE